MARTFRDDLELIGACDKALEWAGDKTLEQAYEQFDHPWWAYWLIVTIGLSTREILNRALILDGINGNLDHVWLLEDPEQSCAAFRKRYPVEVVKQALDEHVQGELISLGNYINEILVSLEQ